VVGGYVRVAQAYERSLSTSAAQAVYDDALRVGACAPWHPQMAAVRRHLWRLALAAGDVDAAGRHYAAAEQVYRRLDDPRGLARLRASWESDRYDAAGRGRSAGKTERPAARSGQIDIDEGYARLAVDGFARAKAHFQALIARAPQDPMPHHHYGAALAFAGRRDEARREYEEALRLHRRAAGRGGDYRHTLLNLALIYERLGRLGDEQALLREALDLDPNGPARAWITAGLARIEARSGDRAGARRRLAEGLLRCAGSGCETFGEVEMATTLAAMELEKGSPRAALAAADAARAALAKARRPETPGAAAGSQLANAQLQLGELYERLGAPRQAAQAYDDGLGAIGSRSFHPTAATLNRRKAALAAAEGRLNEASSLLEEARRAFERLGNPYEAALVERERSALAGPKR
jgi:tetratricopeptide (TPR) repeat protein